MRHIIESQQFDRDKLEELFLIADACEQQKDTPLAPYILATLFYEPSTRTRLSFESAMLRLGGGVISTENAAEFSSAIKGESLEDSIMAVSSFADVIVLRHPEVGAAERAAAVSPVPIINAGDGAGQHPTQALLDLYTIKRELGQIDDTRIVMMGDLKHGRTVRSLSYLLGKYKNVHIDFVSPPALRICRDILEYLKKHKVSFAEHSQFTDVIAQADVVYQTRIQKERFENLHEYDQFKGCHVLTLENTSSMKPSAIIMHPLPRVNEISPELDALPKAAYFRQVSNGRLIRMALLLEVLGTKKVDV